MSPGPRPCRAFHILNQVAFFNATDMAEWLAECLQVHDAPYNITSVVVIDITIFATKNTHYVA